MQKIYVKPPTGVRIVLRDGKEIPCDLIYVGFVKEYHTWAIVNRDEYIPDMVGIKVDILPAHTSVGFY
jgi:hypothetical protein